MNKLFSCITMIFLLGIPMAFSLSLGLTPADVNFNDVLSGGYAEVEYQVMTDSASPITVLLVPLDNSSSRDWLVYEPEPRYVNISAAQPFVGKVKLTVPDGVAPGEYEVLNKFSVLQPLAEGGDTTAQLTIGLAQKIVINVTEQRISGCQIYSYSIGDEVLQSKTMPTSILIKNFGNVQLTTSINYKIATVEGATVFSEQIPVTLNPTVAETVPVVMQTQNLQPGQYVVSVDVPVCNYNSAAKQIYVSSPGEERSRGVITQVDSLNRVQGVVPEEIKVHFVNEGRTTITARLVGKLLKDNVVVQTFTSEDVIVNPASSTIFTEEVVPKTSGRHTLEVYVDYNGLRTPPESTIINFIAPEGEGNSFPIGKVLIGVVIVVLAALVIMKRKNGSRASV
ncbi:MAG TPA: hypothetical protein VK158_06250 [Acidobacteriota bacterium]|nr:hypothetical protein [Acidobacteriota bacterium]